MPRCRHQLRGRRRRTSSEAAWLELKSPRRHCCQRGRTAEEVAGRAAWPRGCLQHLRSGLGTTASEGAWARKAWEGLQGGWQRESRHQQNQKEEERQWPRLEGLPRGWAVGGRTGQREPQEPPPSPPLLVLALVLPLLLQLLQALGRSVQPRQWSLEQPLQQAPLRPPRQRGRQTKEQQQAPPMETASAQAAGGEGQRASSGALQGRLQRQQ